MPKSPEERLSALEETVKSIEGQASQINDLQSSVESLQSQFQGQTDGINEQNAKMDQILAAVQAANSTPPADAPEPPEAPKAKVEEVPAPAALTAAEIAQAVKDATSGDIDALKQEISDLKAGNFEASRTKLPESETDDEEASASVGDEGGEGSASSKLETYADFFAADREVNPEGWSIDDVPQTEAGVRALRNMELRYGDERTFNAAAFDHKVKLGGKEFPIIHVKRQTIAFTG